MTKTLLLYLIIAYLGMLAYAFLFSNSMIFLPPRPAGYEDDGDIIKLKTSDGATIAARYLPNPNAQYLLLVSHGNAIDIGHLQPLLERFQQHHFAVLAYDYHGYGLSTGRPTEKRACMDVRAAYDYATQQLGYRPEQIIAYGRSLGAALALDLAIHKPVGGLILQSPFVTAFRVVTRIPLLPFDKFNNLKKITRLKCPLLLIHSKKDEVIGFWHGKKLYRAAPSPKQHLWIEHGGHNDPVWDMDSRYWDSIQIFTKSLRSKS